MVNNLHSASTEKKKSLDTVRFCCRPNFRNQKVQLSHSKLKRGLAERTQVRTCRRPRGQPSSLCVFVLCAEMQANKTRGSCKVRRRRLETKHGQYLSNPRASFEGGAEPPQGLNHLKYIWLCLKCVWLLPDILIVLC